MVLGQSVGLSVTIMSHAKTAELIEMPVGFVDSGGPKEPFTRLGTDPACEGVILRGEGAAHCEV